MNTHLLHLLALLASGLRTTFALNVLQLNPVEDAEPLGQGLSEDGRDSLDPGEPQGCVGEDSQDSANLL